MLKKARSWVLLTMTLLLVGMVLCMSAVYLVDPFEHYRESAILPLYDQESYNNPGIAVGILVMLLWNHPALPEITITTRSFSAHPWSR